MTIELIDSHTHLSAPDFDADRDAVVQRAKENGVTTLITIGAGYGAESAKKSVEIAEEYLSVFATVGIHPHDSKCDFAIFEQIKELSVNPHVVAIGETGLDFYRDWAPVDLQEKWFRAQIQLAKEVKKPLIIHSREAAARCFEILSETSAADVGGVFHCFSEDTEFAQKLESINFIISVPGSVTFKKADKLREVVKNIPLERIMLETDAPYLAPEPNRGKRCESSFLLETAKFVAGVKNVSLEEVASKTTATAKKFFGLS